MPAEWLCERGVGETRAALVENGAILEARVERNNGRARLGAIVACRLLSRAPNGRAMAEVPARGWRILLDAPPPGLATGSRLLVEVVREAIPERGRLRPAHGRLAPPESAEREAPGLLAEIAATGAPVREMPLHAPDLIERAGWSALIDEARTGEIGFPGGRLLLYPTPAMSLFDVDGTLPPAELAEAAARAAALAVRRHGIGGSIGIDFPTLADRAARQAVAAIVDAHLPPPFERTAVNGFGFLQIVRRRDRASLPELVRGDPHRSAAIELFRRAVRTPGAGTRALACRSEVAARIADAELDALRRATGHPHIVRVDPAAPWGGHVDAEHP